jgi:hypothetical protein
MKHRVLVLSTIIFLAAFVAAPPWASSETYGHLRALKRRAATVMRQKNDFVARVLHSYNIPYQLTEQGVVARLQLGANWLDVNRIEIVPLVREGEHGLQVMGHEIFFYTEGDILHLVSSLTIR